MPRPAKRKLARITSPSGWAPRVDQGPGRFFSPAQHFGLSLRGESVCVFRDWLSIFASSQPKLSADYATFSIRKRETRKRDQPRITRMETDFGRINPRNPRLRIQFLSAAHVSAGARVDLDGFAFLDEERDVDCFAGLEHGRFGDVAGSVAAQALR